MRRQLLPAFVMLALFTALTGVAYPLSSPESGNCSGLPRQTAH
jgi:K+-transporting ATPase c subunit